MQSEGPSSWFELTATLDAELAKARTVAPVITVKVPVWAVSPGNLVGMLVNQGYSVVVTSRPGAL